MVLPFPLPLHQQFGKKFVSDQLQTSAVRSREFALKVKFLAKKNCFDIQVDPTFSSILLLFCGNEIDINGSFSLAFRIKKRSHLIHTRKPNTHYPTLK